MSPKTAPHLLHGAQDQRVRSEHDCNTCWSTRTLTDVLKTMKAGFVLTRQQARLSEQDCSTGLAVGRSTSRPSEEKLDEHCKRVDIPSH
ncbi:hypothetical protein DPMN_043379 [Dreissena polymorpha]|uniref:Uncharacterized protein n=1 Tax=Dreissena polymorpha TaxID=45954 RepID=A0A9D4D2M6_DREPO|nr:hypothetical protein DPMN_043379 [Dreissena polymorpha]